MLAWRSLPLVVLLLAGCPDSGEDGPDGGDPGVDAPPAVCGLDMDGPTPANCPPDAPDREEMCGACCWRASNADRLDGPELRQSALRLRTPSSLSNVIVAGLLTAAIDEERFNWALRMSISGSDVTLEHGHAERNDDGTFSFVTGEAPPPGDPNRWDPATVTGTLTGDTVHVQADDTVTLASINPDGSVSVEMPLRQLDLELTFSHDRTCVGERRISSYGTDDAMFTTYIAVEDAVGLPVTVPGAIDTTLCMFLAGRQAEETGTCSDTPQQDWPVPPNATCDDSGCSLGGCTPATCNAYQVTAEFALQGVEITD